MKKNFFSHKAMTALAVIVLAAMMLAGCKKEEITPITPNDTTTPEEPIDNSHFYYGNDTLAINSIIKMNSDGMYVYYFQLSNNYSFSVMSLEEIGESGASFTDIYTFFFTGSGTLGAMSSDDEEAEDDYMANGSIKISEEDGIYTIAATGTTESGKAIDIFYQGKLIDLNTPTGNGTVNVNGNQYQLISGIWTSTDGYYLYELFSSQMDATLDISSLHTLSNGSYTITTDEDELASGNAVAMEFYINDEDEMESEFILNSGTLNCTISGDTYTISFSGSANGNTITGNFTGSLHEVSMKKDLEKNISKRIAKLRK